MADVTVSPQPGTTDDRLTALIDMLEEQGAIDQAELSRRARAREQRREPPQR